MNAIEAQSKPSSLIAELENIHLKAENLAIASPVGFHIESRVLAVLEELGVAPAEIDSVVFPDGRPDALRTASELSAAHSDRACRLARVVNFAEQVFDNHQKAFLWLRAPNSQLMNRSPLECLATETGAKAVEELLARIDFGIAA